MKRHFLKGRLLPKFNKKIFHNAIKNCSYFTPSAGCGTPVFCYEGKKLSTISKKPFFTSCPSRNTLLLGCIFFLTGWGRGYSQNQPRRITGSVISAADSLGIPEDGLKIGDSIPEVLWHLSLQVVNQPEGKDTITLNDYRGKLIILDFWATWCGSCIAKFPKLAHLEKQYNGHVKIVGITNENIVKANTFFQRKLTSTKDYSIMSVVNNKVFDDYFPHRLIPHYVWISNNGLVQAITAAEEINENNIKEVLNKPNIGLKTKKDLDGAKPLFLSTDFPGYNELKQYSILSKGTYRGYPQGSSSITTNGKVHGRSVTNGSLLRIYEVAARHLFEVSKDHYNKKRLLLHTTDSSKIAPKAVESSEAGLDNFFNYSIVVPIECSDSLYSYMLEDLNRYSSYTGKVEKRDMKCLILVKLDNIDYCKTKGGKQQNTLFSGSPAKLINCPIDYLVNRIDALPITSLPVLNETGISDNIDIVFKNIISNINDLKSQLNSVGLDLIEANRMVNVFLLSNK